MRSLFDSFFLGGFECSTHKNEARRRLDIIGQTKHDRFALEDYRRLKSVGVLTARDGVRWHLVERSPNLYDFSSVLGQVRAAETAGIQVLWDLLHYGYPDNVDFFRVEPDVTELMVTAEPSGGTPGPTTSVLAQGAVPTSYVS